MSILRILCVCMCVCVCVCVCECVCVCVCVCTKFQEKQIALTFLAQMCPKMDLRFKIQKTNVGITISILEILCMPIFRQNKQL